LPYYEKFLARFPTPVALAKASEEQVLAHWAGLGYYRRAKLLHQGAKELCAHFSGKLPSEVEGLKKIPGIGAYTAGAIASIAFERPSPLVDGNVVRVFSRLFALPGHAKENSLHQKVWALAAELLDPAHPGDFNQALMELGATVCRAPQALCLSCPLSQHCQAYRLGRP